MELLANRTILDAVCFPRRRINSEKGRVVFLASGPGEQLLLPSLPYLQAFLPRAAWRGPGGEQNMRLWGVGLCLSDSASPAGTI
jgi:hypothetical protein